MLRSSITLALVLAIAAPAHAQVEPATPDGVIASASGEEWVTIAPQDLLVMELAPDIDGTERRVIIQLIPAPFSQPWVSNIRTLARAHWWDGKSVYRAVDNWVVQWGDVSEEKALPEGVVSPKMADPENAFPPGEEIGGGRFVIDALKPPFGGFVTNNYSVLVSRPYSLGAMGHWTALNTPENGHPLGMGIQLSPFSDPYGPYYYFYEGFPVAASVSHVRSGLPDPLPEAWPIHCYGHVGVARNVEDTGTGAELYAVIGHAPRQLDRNIAVVGRVVEGMEHLSTLKRGTGEAGVYESRDQDTPIVSVRLASELGDPPAFEYLDTSSESFARYVEVRANRQDAFYTVPAGGVDICNVQVPVRRVEN